jgi:hypothetical protein
MNFRFVVESRTNAPDKAKNALVEALDLHRPFHHLQWNVSGQELSSHVNPDNIGTSPGGDFWRFYVEVETNSPDWTRLEIERAIRNHSQSAQLGLIVEQGHILMGQESTSDDAGDWLRERQDEYGM